MKRVDSLIRQGAEVNRAGRRRNTPLHHAALFGRPDVVERLLRGGADVNAVADNGVTPLHNAAAAGSAKAAILLDAGADPRAIDDHGATPLDVASGIRGSPVEPVHAPYH